MTFADVSVLAQIVGSVGTLLVAVVALLISIATLRTQQESLPVSADFGIGKLVNHDQNGVPWAWAWMKNTGCRAFVHDVHPSEIKPDDMAYQLATNLARVGMPDSLPPRLKSASRREIRKEPGVFAPCYLRTNAYSMFRVSLPAGVEKVKFTAAMSVTRRAPVRFVSSQWIVVPERHGRNDY